MHLSPNPHHSAILVLSFASSSSIRSAVSSDFPFQSLPDPHLSFCHYTRHEQRYLRARVEGDLGNLNMSVLVYIRISYVKVGQVIPVHSWHLCEDRQNLVQVFWDSDASTGVPHHLIVKSWLNSSPDNNVLLAYIPLSNFIGLFFCVWPILCDVFLCLLFSCSIAKNTTYTGSLPSNAYEALTPSAS